MELFLPSVLALFLGFLVFLYVMPKLSPYIIGMVAIVLFFIGLQQHYKTFAYEYNSSNWSDLMHDYAPFITVIAGIIGTSIACMLAFGSTSGSSSGSMLPALPGMPAILSTPVAMPAMPAMPAIMSTPVAMPSLSSITAPFSNSKSNASRAYNMSAKGSPGRNIVSNSFKTA